MTVAEVILDRKRFAFIFIHIGGSKRGVLGRRPTLGPKGLQTITFFVKFWGKMSKNNMFASASFWRFTLKTRNQRSA